MTSVLAILARGQRWVADVLDMAIEELISAHLLPIMECRVGWGGGSVQFTWGGMSMDTTVSGKMVGDVLDVVVGPAKDSAGRVLSAGSFDFAASDPAVLGLELDPGVQTLQKGQRAARVTILDVADAQLTVTFNRPSRGPLAKTIAVTGTQPESSDQAEDFDVSVTDETPRVDPNAPQAAVSPTGRFPGQGTAMIEGRQQQQNIRNQGF